MNEGTIPRDAVCVALDTNDLERVVKLVTVLAPHAGWFKVGSTLFLEHGPRALDAIKSRNAKVFLDLKLHDIPAQVAGATAACSRMGVDLLTLHAAGGRPMLEAAREGCGGNVALVAVTVLTSLDADDFHAVFGNEDDPAAVVKRLALLAVEAGMSGVVLSPAEVAEIRAEVPSDFMLVVPGIRPGGASAFDQARTGAPDAAMKDGADLLVIGRPVTAAPDPEAALSALRSGAGG